MFWKGFLSIQNVSLRWMVNLPIFSEKTNWKENPSIVKLLSWKTFPSKKAYFWLGRFSFQCLTVETAFMSWLVSEEALDQHCILQSTFDEVICVI